MSTGIKTLAVCGRCRGNYDRSKRSTGNVNLCGPCWKIVQSGEELKPGEGNALLPRPKMDDEISLERFKAVDAAFSDAKSQAGRIASILAIVKAEGEKAGIIITEPEGEGAGQRDVSYMVGWPNRSTLGDRWRGYVHCRINPDAVRFLPEGTFYIEGAEMVWYDSYEGLTDEEIATSAAKAVNWLKGVANQTMGIKEKG